MKVSTIAILLAGIQFLSVFVLATPIDNIDSDIIMADIPSFGNTVITTLDNESERASKILCDTSLASPRLHDIDALANKVRVMGKKSPSACWKFNDMGSQCSKIATISNKSGSYAAVSLCGGHVGPWNCDQVADAIMAIKAKCTQTMYAGGRWYPGDGMEVPKWIRGGRVALHKK